ncbi:MAG: amino acid adenylation domain-containing protein [Chitinispirillaceae bacterium]|nr:amino acid adenylation domain-containing protein [Chitinispirillaceae bacterium]
MIQNTTNVRHQHTSQEYPLSWFQERMWLLNRKTPHDLSYDIPVVFLLEGEISVDSLNRSITEILDRHETLRARFIQNKRGEAVQVITPNQPFSLQITDVQETDIPHYIEENMRHVFDLENGPVFTGNLLRINPKRYLLLLNVHHIAADGWSVESILFSELQKCYEAFSSGNIPSLKQLPLQYTQFAQWQRKIDMTDSLIYWRKHLSGYEASLELPSDFLRTPQSGSTSGRLEYRYSAEFSQELEKFAQAHGCTMFMCLLAGLALTVNRYTGRNDLCIGTTTSGRILPEIEQLIGFFINILPLRITVGEEMSVGEFMNSIRTTALAGFDHQIVPYERIIYSSIVQRSDASGSLVPLVIRHQNFPRTHLETLLPGGVKFGSYPGYEGYRTATGKDAIARCEVELSYTGDRNKLDVEAIYATDLYHAKTVEQLLRHHEQLLREMMTSSQRRLSDLTMLTDTDRRRLFIDFNQTKRDVDHTITFVTRWDEQVRKTPDAVACYDSFGSWRYRDVADVSNALNHTLKSKGVKPGDLIGICIERTAPLLSAVFAIWRSGAAYVPLDPSYPENYLNQIINDAQPKFIICTKEQQTKLGFNEESCCIIDAKLPLLPNTPATPTTAVISPDSPAYLMYTSGSTGIPKGARVPHRQLTNWLSGLESNWPFAEGEVFAQKTTIAFAVSVKEIFSGLLNGCTVAFIDTESVKDPVLFVDALLKYKASRIHLVPSHMMAVLSYIKKENIALPSLRICYTAGEPLTAEMVTLFRLVLPHARLINNYGCTELNDMCYYDTTNFDATQQGFVPVGRPIQNTTMYILDRNGRPVPLGVPGEVHVATVGMALGYHNLDELNKERFIQNPFSRDYGGILYNTGDVVRYLQDGNLEFLGRWDFQVKIRGFRVDVRHIEKVMGDYDGMGIRAVVGENGQLLAFFVQQSGTAIDIKKLREFLQRKLPPYMVPTAFIAVNEMPKLPNGKLNRRALKVSSGMIQQSGSYEAPSTEIEKKLAELWSEVLEIPEERIGKRSHFFELGGHSLSATRLIARIKERLGIESGLSLVFEHPRLNELASNLPLSTKAQDSDDDSIIVKSLSRPSVKCQSRIPGLLEGKVVLVTGGSRGIGRSTVRLLASHGASVAINYLKSRDGAMAVKEIINEDGGTADIFQGDTTDPAQVSDLVKNVRERFGKIDVLVSNAAIGFNVSPFMLSKWEDFERKLSNELKSVFLLCQAVVPEMIDRKNGSIIAISSTMSKHAQPGYSAHGAAKAALDSFVRSLADELGPDGVRINTVAPGLTLTDATAPMAQQIKETAATRCPLRRNGLPRDIAGAILFLASDLSQFMTGTYLPVDGGYTTL